MYIYKDITNATRHLISFLAFLGMTEGVDWRQWALVGQTDSSASMFCVDVDFYIRVIVLNWTVCSF